MKYIFFILFLICTPLYAETNHEKLEFARQISDYAQENEKARWETLSHAEEKTQKTSRNFLSPILSAIFLVGILKLVSLLFTPLFFILMEKLQLKTLLRFSPFSSLIIMTLGASTISIALILSRDAEQINFGLFFMISAIVLIYGIERKKHKENISEFETLTTHLKSIHGNDKVLKDSRAFITTVSILIAITILAFLVFYAQKKPEVGDCNTYYSNYIENCNSKEMNPECLEITSCLIDMGKSNGLINSKDSNASTTTIKYEIALNVIRKISDLPDVTEETISKACHNPHTDTFYDEIYRALQPITYENTALLVGKSSNAESGSGHGRGICICMAAHIKEIKLINVKPNYGSCDGINYIPNE
ncbi:MAG: hypothetical protein AABY68_02465 [Pseudomonadota bacterium]